MTFDEAKNLMKSQYEAVGFVAADDHAREVFFESHSDRIKIRLGEDEISEFQSFNGTASSYETAPAECSICSQDYREQIVSVPARRESFIYNPDKKFIFGDRGFLDTGLLERVGDLLTGVVWTWRDGRFEIADEIHPHRGYWVYATEQAEIEVQLP